MSEETQFPGAGPPPDGVEPDLDNPTDVLQTVSYVTQGLTIVIVSLFIAIRAYAKVKLHPGPPTFEDCEFQMSPNGIEEGGSTNSRQMLPTLVM